MSEEGLKNFKEYLHGFADLVYATVAKDREIIDEFVKAQTELLSVVASIVEEYGEEGEIYIHPDTVAMVEGKFYNLATEKDDAGGIKYTVEFVEELPDAEQDSGKDIQTEV